MKADNIPARGDSIRARRLRESDEADATTLNTGQSRHGCFLLSICTAQGLHLHTIFSPPSYVLINVENDVAGAEEFCGKHAIKHCISTVGVHT